jgi:hypothetical protein
MRLLPIVVAALLVTPALASAQHGAAAHGAARHRTARHGTARQGAATSSSAHTSDPPVQREVELIEPGAAPQRPLRHRFVAGQSARFRARIRTGLQIAAGGREQSVDVPRMVIETDVGPTEVSHGHLRYAFRVTRADLEAGGSPEVREQLEHEIAALVGARGSVELDDRGTVVHLAFELPANASPSLRQQASSLRSMMGQLLPRFPREPVGIGARWRIRDTIALPQMSLEIATVYELRRWEGDRIDLAVRIERGEGSGGQLPPGVSVDVAGEGRTLMRIGSLATRQRAESRSEVHAPSPSGSARIVMTASQDIAPIH